MATLLDRPDPPDAVFCFNDAMAIGALRKLHSRGVRIPADVAVAGFEDIEELG
jgi:LacI family transcriptional regulator, repressor for deo operon, udp, cdd, tsx, nupC, and nupG